MQDCIREKCLVGALFSTRNNENRQRANRRPPKFVLRFIDNGQSESWPAPILSPPPPPLVRGAMHQNIFCPITLQHQQKSSKAKKCDKTSLYIQSNSGNFSVPFLAALYFFGHGSDAYNNASPELSASRHMWSQEYAKTVTDMAPQHGAQC